MRHWRHSGGGGRPALAGLAAPTSRIKATLVAAQAGWDSNAHFKPRRSDVDTLGQGRRRNASRHQTRRPNDPLLYPTSTAMGHAERHVAFAERVAGLPEAEA